MVSEHDRFAAKRRQRELLLDGFEVHWRLLQDHVVTHDVLGEFWHAEGIEAPVDWVPPLECCVRWHEDDVVLGCVFYEIFEFILKMLLVEFMIIFTIENCREVAVLQEVMKDLRSRLHC
jgi:hypothetical protein